MIENLLVIHLLLIFGILFQSNENEQLNKEGLILLTASLLLTIAVRILAF